VRERNRGIRILGLSIFTLLFIFSIYSFRDTSISQPTSQNLYQLANIVIILTLICLIFGVYGTFNIIMYSNDTSSKPNNVLAYISRILREKYYFNLMLISSLLYGIFFAFLSRIVIYFPIAPLSQDSFNIPSIALTVCCGPPGYFPMATLRLTENFSILFIPLNIILAVLLSLLVGVNVALNLHSMRLLRLRKTKNISLISTSSAFAGLFIGCPTCAGSVLFTILGLGAGTSTLFLAPFQSLFILMSLPILMLTPLLIVRNIRKSKSCTSARENY
jgi:hypothetical protein